MPRRGDSDGPLWRRHLRIARLLVYWGLPPLVLAAIFNRVDLARLQQLLLQIDLPLFVLGLCASPVIVTLGGLRWHVLVRLHPGFRPPLTATVADYWRSLAVGFVLPGSMGTDAYRALTLARQTHHHVAAVILVLVEKCVALLACVLLIVVLLPSQLPRHGRLIADGLGDSAGWVIVALAGAGLAVGLLWALPSVKQAARALRLRVLRAGRRVSRRASAAIGARAQGPRGSAAVQTPRYSATGLGAALVLSVLVFVASAAQVHFFFGAVGHHVALGTNLFVAPLLFVVFALPISFGTLGVREAAFLLFYGLFDVPAEPTLLVSFCGLVGILCSYGVGALLLLRRRRAIQHDG